MTGPRMKSRRKGRLGYGVLTQAALQIVREEGGGRVTRKAIRGLSRGDFSTRKIYPAQSSVSGVKRKLLEQLKKGKLR